MTRRGGTVAVVGLSVVCLVLAGIYFVVQQRGQTAPVGASSIAVSGDLPGLLEQPHIVFRNTQLGPDYGRVGVVSTAQPGGARAITGPSCERVYAVALSGVCITAKRGVSQSYALTELDASLDAAGSSELLGLPSRARISQDGALVATTTFVTGHSYAQVNFSTETVVRRDGASLGNLESFTTIVDGQPLVAVDRNLWGVTFAADDDVFYVTAASGGSTWLMKGSFLHKTLTSLHSDAECPSLSPDGTRIAYKKRLSNKATGVWRLAVLDLATQNETILAEPRSVDDQVEWLDDGHLLYALPRAGTEATSSDIWVLAVDGSSPSKVLIPYGSSPAVVRP